MSAVDVPASGASNGGLIGELKYFPNCMPHDMTAGGERWLQTGYMETDPTKFNAQLWRLSIGTYWQPTAMLASINVLDVASNGAGIVIASLSGGLYSRSTDGGLTFSGSMAFQTGGYNIFAVEWIAALGFFVAVGVNGHIFTSPDGQAWTVRSSGTSATLNAVKWTGTTLVVVGASKTILTSANGINYTARTANISATSNQFYQIVSANGKILAFAESTANGSAISEDNGVTWTTITIDAIAGGVFGATHDGNKFVVLCNGNRIATSVNGKDWVATSLTKITVTSSSILFADGQYWISSNTPGRYLKSEDLVTWREFDIDFSITKPGANCKIKKVAGQYWAMGNDTGLYRGNNEPYAGWPVPVSSNAQDVTGAGAPGFVRIS